MIPGSVCYARAFRIAALVATLLVAPISSALSPKPAAAAGPAFVCSSVAYVSAVTGGSTQLYAVNSSSVPFAFRAIGAVVPEVYNALGYNVVDNYLYALTNNHLLQIDSGGAAIDLGAVTGLPAQNYVAATMLPDGTYVMVSGNTPETIYRINVAARAVIGSVTISSATAKNNDLAYNPLDGLIYAIDESGAINSIIAFDPVSGTVIKTITQSTTAVKGNAGGQWFDSAGNFFFVSTGGGVYSVSLSTGDMVKLSSIANTNGIDAAACSSSFALSKQVSPTTALPGAVVTYTYIASNGSGVPATVDFTDDLTVVSPGTPVNGTFVGGSVTVSNGSGITSLSGGGHKLSITGLLVPARGSVNITAQVTLPVGATAGTYANQAALSGLPPGYPASVLSDDPTSPAIGDPTAIQVVAPTLAITKTDNGPWDVGQSLAAYTLTVRNTGSAPTSGTITVTDALPSNLTISSTPVGAGWNCSGSSGASVTCTSTTVISVGGSATPITVPVNIGLGTPVGTNAISNTASSFGGGDPTHTSLATAATSGPDTTTIGAPSTLTAAGTNGAIAPGTTATDIFTLTNTSALGGNFAVSPPNISGPAGPIAPSGFTLNIPGNPGGVNGTYPTLAALNAALALPSSQAANGTSITIGVEFLVPVGLMTGQTTADQVSATIATATGTSPPANATVTDSVRAPSLQTSKSDNGPWTIGQSGAQYTISVANLGAAPTTGTITIRDTLPANLTLRAAPVGSGWNCAGSTGASVVCSTAAVIAAGASAPSISVPVTIGAGTPTGTNSISNIAGSFGGGDPVHTGPGSASNSPADTTTINPLPTLVVTGAGTGTLIAPGTVATDTFTLTNTSSQPGNFNIASPPSIVGPRGAIIPSGYTLNGAPVPHIAGNTPFQDLQAALAALGPTPAGGSVTVGVRYPVPGGAAGLTITDTLSATIAAGGATSVIASANVTDTLAAPPQLSIAKTANTPSGQPGDVVTYALDISDHSSFSANDIVVTDFLPRGFAFVAGSASASIAGVPAAVSASQSGSTLQFSLKGSIAPGALLHIVYAATIGPDAMRGDGRNVALVSALINGVAIRAQPASATIALQPGILESCGTIVGRVFVDLNGDGEQEPGEAGVPHAVVVMDDGTRIETDQDGMYHVACTHPGWRTGTLDAQSVPGYATAPNLIRLDKTTATVTVQLEAGGMARMNFAVIKKRG